MPRKKIDLHRLPLWLQYLIAILVAGTMFGLVYALKGSEPASPWIITYLTDRSGVTALGLVILFSLIWLVHRLTRR